MKCPESWGYSRMNVQNKEIVRNGGQPPFYMNDDNGNDISEGENIPHLLKDECNVNVCAEGLRVFDSSHLHNRSLQDASSSCSLTSSNGLELADTVDFISKAVEEDGTSTEKAALPESSKLIRLYANTVEEGDPVDYVTQEPSQLHSGSIISSPTPIQTRTQSEIVTGADHFRYMHNMHNRNVEQPVPYVQESTDECFGNTQFSRTSQFTLKQADEACGNFSSDQVGLCTVFNKTKKTESTNNESVSCTNSLSLSWDLSDEMRLRKNSFLSSGSEKPKSTSVLEASGLPNASTDMYSESIKWANGEPDDCPGSGPPRKDSKCLEVPQHQESKEREKMNMCCAPEPGVITVEPSAVHLEDGACKSNEKLDNDHLRLPDKVDVGIKEEIQDDVFVTPVMTNEPVTIVLAVDVDLKTKDVNGVLCGDSNSLRSSHRPQSPSSNAADVLSNSSGPSCDDTFLIPSSNSSSQTHTSTPLPESRNITFAVPELDVFADDDKRKTTVESEGEPRVNVLDALKAGPVGGTLRAANRKLTVAAPVTKVKKNEVISFPKPNFKNVKAKVLTRPALQVKDGASSSSKHSPSLSNASSPVASPRTPASAVGTLRKKSLQEPNLKAETAIAKSQKQPINKQLFPSQVAHVPTHSKPASGKVPRTAVLKQTQDELDRASSSNSTRSSGSATADACTAGFRPAEKERTVPQHTATNMAPMGPDKINQNGIVDPSYKQADNQNGNCITGDILADIVPLATPAKNLNKNLLSRLRNSTTQPVCSAKARALPATQRPGSAPRNVVTVRVSSPPKVSPQAIIAGGLGSPKRKSISVNASAAIGTRSLPRSRVPIKATTLPRTYSVSSGGSSQSEQSTLSGRSTTTSNKTEEVPAKCMRQNGGPCTQPSKTAFSRGRSQSLKVAQTGLKKSPSAIPGVTKSAVSSIPVTRRVEIKACVAVEKGKQKTSPRGPVAQVQTPPVDAKAVELTECKATCEQQRGVIKQLKNLLTCSNQRFEALTLVIQNVITQRESARKKCLELSLELQTLHENLVQASGAFDKLEKEKHDFQVAQDGILQKVRAEHHLELNGLEERLKAFYTGECEKLQTILIEEAEKYKNELQEKVDTLNSTHESYRLETETSHLTAIEKLKQQYDLSLTEFQDHHENEKTKTEESFKDSLGELETKIDGLKSENESLKEKMQTMEEQKESQSSPKPPQPSFLEQELESLKVVLDMKNEKLHQQEKKLMQVEKLVETNNILVEKLNKSRQENEELKARMANHIAISRQLSTDQELLQKSLDKESKANKRLSMENEELLWKLHNGDICSPKKLSPSSPGISFRGSRNSGSFSSPPTSPR